MLLLIYFMKLKDFKTVFIKNVYNIYNTELFRIRVQN